jgi:hypothetical protein
MKTEHQKPISSDLGLTIFLAKQRAELSEDPKALAVLEELEPMLLKEAEKLAGEKRKPEYVDWGSVALNESLRRRRQKMARQVNFSLEVGKENERRINSKISESSGPM